MTDAEVASIPRPGRPWARLLAAGPLAVVLLGGTACTAEQTREAAPSGEPQPRAAASAEPGVQVPGSTGGPVLGPVAREITGVRTTTDDRLLVAAFSGGPAAAVPGSACADPVRVVITETQEAVSLRVVPLVEQTAVSSPAGTDGPDPVRQYTDFSGPAGCPATERLAEVPLQQPLGERRLVGESGENRGLAPQRVPVLDGPYASATTAPEGWVVGPPVPEASDGGAGEGRPTLRQLLQRPGPDGPSTAFDTRFGRGGPAVLLTVGPAARLPVRDDLPLVTTTTLADEPAEVRGRGADLVARADLGGAVAEVRLIAPARPAGGARDQAGSAQDGGPGLPLTEFVRVVAGVQRGAGQAPGTVPAAEAGRVLDDALPVSAAERGLDGAIRLTVLLPGGAGAPPDRCWADALPEVVGGGARPEVAVRPVVAARPAASRLAACVPAERTVLLPLTARSGRGSTASVRQAREVVDVATGETVPIRDAPAPVVPAGLYGPDVPLGDRFPPGGAAAYVGSLGEPEPRSIETAVPLGPERLALTYGGGDPDQPPGAPCGSGGRGVVVAETETSVTVDVVGLTPVLPPPLPDTICPAIAYGRAVEVVLAQPLGDRTVRDAGSGDRVPVAADQASVEAGAPAPLSVRVETGAPDVPVTAVVPGSRSSAAGYRPTIVRYEGPDRTLPPYDACFGDVRPELVPSMDGGPPGLRLRPVVGALPPLQGDASTCQTSTQEITLPGEVAAALPAQP